MDRYKETFETWDKVAQLYQDKFMGLSIYNGTYDYFCDQITRSQPKILEIGCGPGNITHYILKKRPDFQFECIDVSPNMIELARQNNPSAHCQVMDCRDLSSGIGEFQGIIAGFCIPYLSKLETENLVDLCHQILVVDGIFYISFVNGEENDSGFQQGSTGLRTYFNHFSKSEILRILQAYGFELIHQKELAYEKSDGSTEMHQILICRKRETAILPS